MLKFLKKKKKTKILSRFCKKAVLHVCLRSLNCTCKGVHFLLKLQTRGRSNPPMAFLFTTLFSKCLVDNCFRRLRAFFQVKNIFQITSAELLLYIGSVRNLPIFFLMDRLEFRESLLGQSRGQVSKGIVIKII